MSTTQTLDTNGGVRVIDSETLAPIDTYGAPDLDKTDYLTVTINGSTRAVTLGAANDNSDDVDLALAPKGDGVLLLPQIANASLPAAAAGNEGAVMYDSTNNKLVVSTGSAWETVTSS